MFTYVFIIGNWTFSTVYDTLQLYAATVLSHLCVWHQMYVPALLDTLKMENYVHVCS